MKNLYYWVGCYKDPITGQQRSKAFSIKKLGEEQALNFAIEWREAALKDLVANHGYNPNHGK